MYTRSASLITVAVILTLLAALAVILRFIVRRNTNFKYGTDDWIILLAVLTQFGSAGNLIWSAVAGGDGDTIENIVKNPKEASNYAKFLFVGPLIFTITISLIKISTLTLYKRIFITKSFRVLCDIMIGLTAGWFLASFLGCVFASKPVSLGWKYPVRNALNFGAFQVSIATINLALDLGTVCLPLLVIATLKMTFDRKLGVSGIFMLGLFCIVASAIRLYYFVALLRAGSDQEQVTSVAINDTIWSFIEPCMSITTACLPTLAPLFRGGRDLGSIVRSVRSMLSLSTTASKKSPRGSNRSKESKGSNHQETRDAKKAWQKLNKDITPGNDLHSSGDVELDEIRPLHNLRSGTVMQTEVV